MSVGSPRRWSEKRSGTYRRNLFRGRVNGPLANRPSSRQALEMVEPVSITCQECGCERAADSPDLRLELTIDDEPVFYRVECWELEFGQE